MSKETSIDVRKAIELAMPSWAIVDGTYRYALGRGVGSNVIAWVMFNPSVADALKDDPTIRKVRKFTRLLAGEDARFVVVNLFAWRATSPKALVRAGVEGHDTVGPWNTIAVEEALAASSNVVVAWGANKGPNHEGAVARVVGQIKKRGVAPLCLGCSADGSPRHPLMLAYATAFDFWKLP